MKIKQIIKIGLCCILLQNMHISIDAAAPAVTAPAVKKHAVAKAKTAAVVKAPAVKTAAIAKAPVVKTATVAKAAVAVKAVPAAKKTAAVKKAPVVKAAPVVSAEQTAKSTSVLTSVYVQNTFNKDATLNEIEIVVASQKKPLIKKGLSIKVPGKKSIYDKGSMVSFDIAANNKDFALFNGIKSITVDKDKIVFDTLQTAFQSTPIKITNKDNKWVADTK